MVVWVAVAVATGIKGSEVGNPPKGAPTRMGVLYFMNDG